MPLIGVRRSLIKPKRAAVVGYTPQGVHFSSTGPQSISNSSALTGVSDGTVGLVSFWFKAEGSDANVFRIFSSGNAGNTINGVILDRLTSGVIRLICQNSSGSNVIIT